MENMDKGLTTKMGADSLAEITPNAPEFICPICLPKPKSSGFQWKKASLGVRSQWPLQTPNEAFFIEIQAFGLGQTNWADKFWGIWGIFGQTISTHFGSWDLAFVYP